MPLRPVTIVSSASSTPGSLSPSETRLTGMKFLVTDANEPKNMDNNFLSPDGGHPKLQRSQSRAFLSEDGLPQPIEYFLASDAAAIVEHTKRVLYLEDDDIAHIANGGKFFEDLDWGIVKRGLGEGAYVFGQRAVEQQN
jgi:glucosamine--fructose-6-phosphate aminotransferase (isomerizing)